LCVSGSQSRPATQWFVCQRGSTLECAKRDGAYMERWWWRFSFTSAPYLRPAFYHFSAPYLLSHVSGVPFIWLAATWLTKLRFLSHTVTKAWIIMNGRLWFSLFFEAHEIAAVLEIWNQRELRHACELFVLLVKCFVMGEAMPTFACQLCGFHEKIVDLKGDTASELRHVCGM
jgi:hypothetical protein